MEKILKPKPNCRYKKISKQLKESLYKIILNLLENWNSNRYRLCSNKKYKPFRIIKEIFPRI